MTQIGRNAPCHCGSERKYKVCHLPQEEAQRKPQTGEDVVLVLMPTRGQICYETLNSIETNMGCKYGVMRVARKPVVEARNALAKRALEVIASGEHPFTFTPRETFILWLDDDVWLPPGLVPTMLGVMRDSRLQTLDAIFGWFCTRAPYQPPVAFRRFDDGQSIPRIGVDCKMGDVVPVEVAGFHAVMMRSRLLERIGPDPFTPFPEYAESEDWAFCRRAKAIGATLAVGTALPVAHVDPRDGTAYMVGSPPLMVDGNGLRIVPATHLGADGQSKTIEMRHYGLDGEAAHFAAQAAQVEALRNELEKRRSLSTF